MTGPVGLDHTVGGSPDAPVVVLVHAIGTSRVMWDPQVRPLEAAWRLVTVDLRGHGSSPVPVGPYRIDDLGGDLIALLDQLAIDRASICGVSLGGMVALWVAAHAPERVDRLVVAGVVARPVSPEAWLERARMVRNGGTAAVADLVVDRWGYTDRDPEIERFVRALLRTTPAEGYASCCEAIATMDLWPDLRQVAAPTLVLTGSDDPAAPPSAAAGVASSVGDATLKIDRRGRAPR